MRVKDVARLNVASLTESTDPTYEFRYVDIGAVTQGNVAVPANVTTFADAPSRARRLASEGDVLVSTVRTYLRAVAPVPQSGDASFVYSTGFAVLTPDSDAVDPRFLGYVCQSDPFVDDVVARSVGVSYPAINASDIAALPLRVPPLEEQRRIADFLDEQMAAIGHSAELSDRQTELLIERRRAFLDSRLQEHFSVYASVPLWRVYQPSSNAGAPTRAVLSVYRDYGVILKSSRDDNFNKTPQDLSRYLVVGVGDLVVNKMKAWQGSLGVSNFEGIVSPDYEVLHQTSTEFIPSYLHNVLRSPLKVSEFGARSTGIRPAQWRLYWEELRKVQVPMPPLNAQAELGGRLSNEADQIEATIATVKRRRVLLSERRQALITAAVTGQLDVTTASGAFPSRTVLSK